MSIYINMNIYRCINAYIPVYILAVSTFFDGVFLKFTYVRMNIPIHMYICVCMYTNICVYLYVYMYVICLICI